MKRVWKKIAWDHELTFWGIEHKMQKSLDMLSVVNPSSGYLTSCGVSNRYPTVINLCETMARLVCHASVLGTDDIRLKKLPPSSRTCRLCDVASPDNANTSFTNAHPQGIGVGN